MKSAVADKAGTENTDHVCHISEEGLVLGLSRHIYIHTSIHSSYKSCYLLLKKCCHQKIKFHLSSHHTICRLKLPRWLCAFILYLCTPKVSINFLLWSGTTEPNHKCEHNMKEWFFKKWFMTLLLLWVNTPICLWGVSACLDLATFQCGRYSMP